MSGVKVDMMNERKRRPFSWWVIALVVFSLPLMVFSLVVLLEGDPKEPPVPTVDHWLAEANREDGLVWKARRFAYDKLPEEASKFLRLKDPGERHERQVRAIRELYKFPDDIDRIVPVLTALLANTPSEEIISSSCLVVREFGTNALGAMPQLLTMISNTAAYGGGDAWHTALSIEPTNAVLVQLATNILARVTQTAADHARNPSRPAITQDDEGMVWMLAYYLPEMRLPSVEVETYLFKIFASQDVRLTTRTLQAVRNNLTAWKTNKVGFSGEQLSRLLSLWDRHASREVKRDSLYAAVDAATQREQTLPMANRLFAELLQKPDVTFRQWRSVHTLFSSVIPPEPRRLASRGALDWVLERPVDHPEDLGAFIRFDCSTEEQNLPVVRDWFTKRVKASTNPHQASDWSRHWTIYSDFETTAELAVSILKTDRYEARIALTGLLANPGFLREAEVVDESFRRRYGVNDERITERLRSLPDARVVELLVRLLVAVNELPNEIEPKAAALTRLESLLAEFKQEVADAP
jgi:hypothetical protein